MRSLHKLLKLEAEGEQLNRFSWNWEGSLIASGSRLRPTYPVRIWDAHSGELVASLLGHSAGVTSASFSPDGQYLASGSDDRTVRLWDLSKRKLRGTGERHTHYVTSVEWSPRGEMLASTSDDGTVRIWSAKDGFLREIQAFECGASPVLSVAWSPDGTRFATGLLDGQLQVWSLDDASQTSLGFRHETKVHSVAWSNDGQWIASASYDQTVGLLNPLTGERRSLEGHSAAVTGVSFSSDGSLLATKGLDSKARLWRVDDLLRIDELDSVGNWPYSEVRFSYGSDRIAVHTEADHAICTYSIDFAALHDAYASSSPLRYRNAKVMVVGDTGVGKTSLVDALAHEDFVPAMSTFSRRAVLISRTVVDVDRDDKELRETFAWDMPGQPDYRLRHLLQMRDVDVAIVVFDSRHLFDSFSGIRHWVNALKQARQSGEREGSLPIILVASRIDHGKPNVNRATIEQLASDLGIAYYVETSARNAVGIEELASLIEKVTPWSQIPGVVGTEFAAEVRNFIEEEKARGGLLSGADDLYRLFLAEARTADLAGTKEDFMACLGRLETRDILRLLSFANLVLLRPELLDLYAGALIVTAKNSDPPDGTLLEASVLAGRLLVPEEQRIKDRKKEELVLRATIEDMLRSEILLRLDSPDGTCLIFPSQVLREYPGAMEVGDQRTDIVFEGAVQNIYSSLVVRLARSGTFRQQGLWKNGARFSAALGGSCGFSLREIEPGKAALSLFAEGASQDTVHFFQNYVTRHVSMGALQDSVAVRHVFRCPQPKCRVSISHETAEALVATGITSFTCPTHRMRFSLIPAEKPYEDVGFDLKAENEKQRQINQNRLAAQRAANAYDAFIAFNGKDRETVRKLVDALEEYGVWCWLDERSVDPGTWPTILIEAVEKSRFGVVVVGRDGAGPWQENFELATLMNDKIPKGAVIGVYLKGANWRFKALDPFNCVDFNLPEPNPFLKLVAMITRETPTPLTPCPGETLR